ncbi:MAG TPA: Hsp70 family protein [Bryobacteraceae bacterium]|nr:Hsp70 family protein [Bryobacteraceae bacterium]
MKLGIDFGTTRIVVAAVDRGNFPVVTFDSPSGHVHDWFPPLIAVRGQERLYGWEAWDAQVEPQVTVVRSLKRVLEDAGPATRVQIGQQKLTLIDLLTEMMAALAKALRESSSLQIEPGEEIEIMLGVPANANSNQRYLTVEPAQRAGFRVLGLLNEPTAASIEYGHRTKGTGKSERVLVYDLGGGTFDVSLVEVEDRTHQVVASEGISTLGGDDFDVILAEAALAEAGLTLDELTQKEIFLLAEECRVRKEALHPNTKRVIVDLGNVRETFPEVGVPVDEYYEFCTPLVERTAEVTRNLLDQHAEGKRLDALYITGGGSELPLVARLLREDFGRKVKRSSHTRSATAIGLAIQADAQSGYVLRERFSRHFGVWREAEGGKNVVFDVLFSKGTVLPGPGEPPIAIKRGYWPVHNLGHFRFLESSFRDESGRPSGDITLWDEIQFPFDPSLHGHELSSVPVLHSEAARQQLIEEQYECDARGGVRVVIRNRTAGYEQEFRLGRWTAPPEPIVPGRRRHNNRPAGSSRSQRAGGAMRN